jgi:SAM-dependent methyltransferase
LSPISDGSSSSDEVRQHWEQHYGSKARVWSGRVNVQFAESVATLTPGRALDLGCGEGADARWLAERGWHVTAVDISDTALRRAADDAEACGLGDHIVFERHDLSETFPSGSFDLVSAQFLHSTVRLDRTGVLRRGADAVVPGGTLLIIDHGAAPPWASEMHRDHHFATPDEVLGELRLAVDQWERVRVEGVEREAVGPEGQVGMTTDNVMVLRRRFPKP